LENKRLTDVSHLRNDSRSRLLAHYESAAVICQVKNENKNSPWLNVIF